MNARIEHNFVTNGHRVWLFERVMGTLRVLRISPAPTEPSTLTEPRMMWVEIEDRAFVVEPTFELPYEALEALLEAAHGHVRATDATVDALRDAREVRDRLLDLVEEGWHA